MDNLLAEAEALLENGFREINLISQDITAYGSDLKDPSSLPELIRQLDRLGGDFWIRLLYAYPTQVTDELMHVMAETRRVCTYLDIPVQHSHPDMLKTMLRGNTSRHIQSLPERAREQMPGVTLRTTCLVGFPGETDEHFQHLLDYLDKTRFDHVGVFVYSPEDGTPAMNLNQPVPGALAETRRNQLLEAQQIRVREKAESLVGTETRVLLERPAPDAKDAQTWVGRSPRYAPQVDGEIMVRGLDEIAGFGDFVHVRYTAPMDYDMEASATNSEEDTSWRRNGK
jgi:ribosomal protein S12 methylthiotransferase